MKELIIGKANKKQYGFLLLTANIIFIIVALIAQTLFPGNYSPYENHISDQGGILNNPDGHLIFNIGVIITGILLIPYFFWLYHRFLPTTIPLSNLAIFLAVIGCIGFCFVGIFPQDIEYYHDIAADIAFGGFALAILIVMFILARKIRLKEPWPNKLGYFLIYGIIFIVIGLSIYFQNYWDPYSIPFLDPRLSNDEPWQWTFFALILFWMWGIFIMGPNEGKK